MQLVALVERADHVCCRYRVTAFQKSLERAGHSLRLEPIPRRWWSRWLLFRRLRGATVLLQRRLLPAWELALLRANVRHLIFDLDDAVFLRDSYSARGILDPRLQRRFTATVRACDVVVAGNPWLAQQARQLVGPATVVTIPTCVDPGAYPLATHERRDETHLVWVGSSSTLQGLERIRPLLEGVGTQVPGVALKIVCDRFPTFDRLRTIPTPWRGDTEAADIASSDVGISWIPDDDWSRGKCGLKLLQYMAAGLPVVTNPVGVHVDMVEHGRTGFLATTDAEWIAALRTLSRDPALRLRMGRAARARLERDFSVQAGGAAWVSLLGKLEEHRQAG
jgi:glycosyltransferase involved in cell wall biosynthesis